MIKTVRDLTEEELQSICNKQFDCRSCPLSEADFYGDSIACAIELMKRRVEVDDQNR